MSQVKDAVKRIFNELPENMVGDLKPLLERMIE